MGIQITFEAHSMETAPKDRRIMLYVEVHPGEWLWTHGKWDSQEHHKQPRPYWGYDTVFGVAHIRANQPILWAEIAELRPAPSTDVEVVDNPAPSQPLDGDR